MYCDYQSGPSESLIRGTEGRRRKRNRETEDEKEEDGFNVSTKDFEARLCVIHLILSCFPRVLSERRREKERIGSEGDNALLMMATDTIARKKEEEKEE